MEFILIVPVLLLAITIHEVAHAWVAYQEGDPTAYNLGRVTMNPVSHIDPMGSILVPALLFVFGNGLLFGWAKPVPVNPRNFKDYKRGDIRVSLAGIVANLGLAVIFAAVFIGLHRFVPSVATPGSYAGLLAQAVDYGILINLILAFFNLIPIPPLDGSHVLYHMLPPQLGARYRAFGRYGVTFLFLLIIIMPGALGVFLGPVTFLHDVVRSIAFG